MGRPLKPIPEDRPSKLLGEKLRELKGSITYGDMAKIAFCKPNTFSMTADGSYRGWASVEQFLSAINKCGGLVTPDDERECRTLHKIAENLHREEQSAAPPAAPPAPALTETTVLAPIAADGQPADPQPVLAFTHSIEARAYPPSLARATSVQDIVLALVDLVMDKRLDIDGLRIHGPRPHPREQEYTRAGSPEWEVLTGRRPPTLPLVVRIVERCGGGPSDLLRWEQAWQRVVGSRVVGRASVPRQSRGTEERTALDSSAVGDEDLQRLRDGLIRLGTTGEAPVQTVAWWKRWRRKPLQRRPPGAHLDPKTQSIIVPSAGDDEDPTNELHPES